MAAPVAVVGDVTATPGAVLHESTAVGAGTSAPAGTWSAGTIEHETYPQLTSAGSEVIWEAACEFTFSGTDTSGKVVDERETITLTATARPLNPHQHDVLIHGDSESSGYGNTLSVTATGPLRA